MIKSESGITMLTFVVTLIVMLILAAVSLSILLGQNGIILRNGDLNKDIREQDIVETIPPRTPSLSEEEKNTEKEIDELAEYINPPDITGGLIAIYYDEETSQWKELANSSSSEEWERWYKYERQATGTENGGTSRWANAKTESGNMLVWIPRYEYKITKGEHTSKAGTIDVRFISLTKLLPTSGYTIHPAFTNEGNGGLGELSGIWVGKFESSNDGYDNLKIVPNVTSWRSIDISTAFKKCQEFNKKNSVPGYDSHMMKNTEWGAVSYLAHSSYGRNGTEITINNSSGFFTGRAGASTTGTNTSMNGTYTYMQGQGQLASTTGNIYGIYDMSGGASEYVMGMYSDSLGKAGFKTLPASKYYDEYIETYEDCSPIKGDAIYETSGSAKSPYKNSWFNDSSKFISKESPCLIRGGDYSNGSNSGIFAFDTYNEESNSNISFRLVLTK